MKAIKTVLAAMLAAAWVTTAVQAQTWDAGGDGVSWGQGLNWTGDTVPGQWAHVIFNNTGNGTNPKVFDQNRDIAHWDLNHTSGSHDFNLGNYTIQNAWRIWLGYVVGGAQSSTFQNGILNFSHHAQLKVGRDNAARDTDSTLTFDDVQITTTGTGIQFLRVGFKENSDMNYFTRGVLDLTGVRASSVMHVGGGDIFVGRGGRGYGRLLLPANDNLHFQVGINAGRPNTYVGDTEGRVADGYATFGEILGGQADVTFDAAFLVIGHNEQNSGAVTGRVDLSQATGRFRNWGNQARIGFGRHAVGEVLAGPAMEVSFGLDANNRVDTFIGHTQGRNAAGMITTGRVYSAGGDFSIFAGTLYIGENEANNGNVVGRVDVRDAGGGTILTDGSTTRIGAGGRADGRLLLGDGMTVKIGNNNRSWVAIGDTLGGGRNADGDWTYGEFDAGDAAEITFRASGFYVGVNENNSGGVTGVVDFSQAATGTVDTRGQQTRVGLGRQARGTVTVSDNLTPSIGDSDDRTWLRIGVGDNRNADGMQAEGLWQGPMGGYFSIFDVGVNESNTGAATGRVNAASANSPINTRGNQFRVGYGKDARGTVLLGAGLTQIGNSDDRTWIRIGHGENRANSTTEGFVHKAGGTFEGYISNFKVGAYAGSGSTAYGELDLSDTTLTAAGIYINDPARIGQGAGATGIVRLPAGNVWHNSHLLIGESGGTGLLELNGTSFTNNFYVDVYANGQIQINPSGPPSGLTIFPTATDRLRITEPTYRGTDAIVMTFESADFAPSASNPYWGLRWQGNDKTAILQDHLDDGRIVVNIASGANLQMADLTVGTYNDGTYDWSYIGFTDVTVGGTAPTITQSTADPSYVSATVHAELEDHGGLQTTVSVYWGTVNQGQSTSGWDGGSYTFPSAYNSSPQNLSYTIPGLSQGETYYFMYRAVNTSGEDWGAATGTEFITLSGASVPTVANGVATGISASAATLNGTLTDDGNLPTTVSVYWGTVNQGQSTAGWNGAGSPHSFGVDVDEGPLPHPLTGLSGDTEYYFMFRAENEIGATWGAGTGTKFTTWAGTGPYTWDGGAATDIWNERLNWSPDGVPNGTAHVIFNDTAGVGDTVLVDTDRSVNHLDVANTSGAHAFDLNGGKLTVNNWMYVGRNLTGDAALEVRDGVLDLGASHLQIGVKENDGAPTGSLTLDNVRLTNSTYVSYLRVGFNNAGTDSAEGVLDLSAATADSYLHVHNTDWLRIGVGRNAKGELTLADGMTAHFFRPASRNHFMVGHLDSASVGETAEGLVDGGTATIHADTAHLRVGYNGSVGSVTGRVDFSQASGGALTTSANETQVGFGGRAYGELVLGDAMTAHFGNPSRVHMYVGHANNQNAAGQRTAGVVIGNQANISADLAHLVVGHNNAATGSATGRVDFSQASGGALTTSANDTHVGYGGRAYGELFLSPNQTLHIGSPTRLNFAVGYSNGQNGDGGATYGEIRANGALVSADTGYFEVGRNNGSAGSAEGRLDWSSSPGGSISTDGGETRIGSGRNARGTLLLGPSADAWGVVNAQSLYLGYNESQAGTLTQGTMSKSGGTFTGKFNWFSVGHNENNAAIALEGELDLSATTLGAVGIVINNDARIGLGQGATGTVKLPAGGVYVAGSLSLGGTSAQGGAGTLELNGTSWTNNNTVTIGETGQMQINVAGPPSGLTKLSAGSLTLNRTTDAIVMTFDDPAVAPSPTVPYWGLRWQGATHEATLQGWLNTGRIRVEIEPGASLDMADLEVGTYNDGTHDWTFIGFVAISGPDTAPPVWSGGFPTADTPVPDGFAVRAQMNEAGTAYYVVVADGDPAPDSAEVKAGTAAGGGAPLASGTIALPVGGQTGSQAVSGLDPLTPYDVYVVAEDDEPTPNLQAAPALVNITTWSTDVIPPSWISGWPQADTETTSGFTVRARTDEDGMAYYVVVPQNAAAPSAAQVKAGLNASGNPALAAGSMALSANIEATQVAGGLTAGTTYDIYVVAEDEAPNLQASPSKVTAATMSSAITWSNGLGTFLWNSGGNWSGGNVPGVNAPVAFAAAGVGTINVDTTPSVGNVTFNPAAGAFTFINGPITIAGGSTLANNSSAVQTFAGNVTAADLTLTGTGAGETRMQGTVSASGAALRPGPGSRLHIAGGTYTAGELRSRGSSRVEISGGGTLVNSGSSSAHFGPDTAGVTDDRVLVHGALSAWTIGGNLAPYSPGNLVAVSNGAALTINGELRFGDNSSHSNRLDVVGAGSRVTIGSTAWVGFGPGYEQIRILNGASVTNNADVNVGGNTQGSTITISGVGSRWDVGNGRLLLSHGGVGHNQLIITDGGVMELHRQNAGNYLSNAGVNNDILISGAGSKLISHSVNDLQMSNDGASIVTITQGGKLKHAGRGLLHLNATYALLGGTLELGWAFGGGANLVVGDGVQRARLQINDLANGGMQMNGERFEISSRAVFALGGSQSRTLADLTGNFITIGAGSGFGGSGTLVGDYTYAAQATVSPGVDVGTFTQTGNVTFGGGGHYDLDVNDFAGTAGATTGWDLFVVDGTLNVTATSGNRFNINLFSLDAAGDPGEALNAPPSGVMKIVDADSITGFASGAFSVNADGLAGTTGGWQVEQIGNALYLRWIPETTIMRFR